MSPEQRAKVAKALRGVDWHDDQLLLAHVAIVTNINEATLRKWKSRGHLRPIASDEEGRPLYRVIDAWRAQALAEDNLARTQACNLARRRESVVA